MEIEIGKWYKGFSNNNQIACKAVMNKYDYIYYNERINFDDGYQCFNEIFYWRIPSSGLTEITDLLEIDEYLPDNHPDKILIPKITHDDFDSILPEKWCLKVTPESYAVFKHLRELSLNNGYITSESVYDLGWGYWTLEVYGIEISLDQFRKYVLKDLDLKLDVGLPILDSNKNVNSSDVNINVPFLTIPETNVSFDVGNIIPIIIPQSTSCIKVIPNIQINIPKINLKI
jgi:hypothetical protein